jgi:formate-dependent nitrite reductase cytochrome c552 subunit
MALYDNIIEAQGRGPSHGPRRSSTSPRRPSTLPSGARTSRASTTAISARPTTPSSRDSSGARVARRGCNQLGWRRDACGRVEGRKAESKLVGDPRLKTIFNGYAFAIDYRERRGHAFMLDDQRDTERVKQKPPARRVPQLPRFQRRGVSRGGHQDSARPARSTIRSRRRTASSSSSRLGARQQTPIRRRDRAREHPVTCLDCHDPKTMALRITRPAFIEGIANLAASATPCHTCPASSSGARAIDNALQPQRSRQPPGDALDGVRPVPRRVLLQG